MSLNRWVVGAQGCYPEYLMTEFLPCAEAMDNNATIGDLMTLTSVQNNRNSNRLRGYDYTLARAYFVTIVTYQHQCLFGEIINGEVTLSSLGLIAYEQWQRLGKRFTKADFSTFVIMPNHVHGIIQLCV